MHKSVKEAVVEHEFETAKGHCCPMQSGRV